MLAPRQVVQAGLQRVLGGTSSSINPVSAFSVQQAAPNWWPRRSVGHDSGS
jgi:hypothetical protein